MHNDNRITNPQYKLLFYKNIEYALLVFSPNSVLQLRYPGYITPQLSSLN